MHGLTLTVFGEDTPDPLPIQTAAVPLFSCPDDVRGVVRGVRDHGGALALLG